MACYDEPAFGARLLTSCIRRLHMKKDSKVKKKVFQILVIITTFVIYTCYHTARAPIFILPVTNSSNCSRGGEPKDAFGTRHETMDISLTFLASYAVGLFITSATAQKVDLRLFGSVSCIASGACLAAFGAGYFINFRDCVTKNLFYIVITILIGITQATGLPFTVESIAHWIGIKHRGLIMGIWATNMSLGNIIGAKLGYIWNDDVWYVSFFAMGAIMVTAGIITFFFLVPYPESVKCRDVNEREKPIFYTSRSYTRNVDVPTLGLSKSPGSSSTVQPAHGNNITFLYNNPISWRQALLIPGVIDFSFCLLFNKMTNYIITFWLPQYLQEYTEYPIQYMSVYFELGGIIGGIALGYLTDVFGNRSIVTCIMIILSVPSLLMFNAYRKQQKIATWLLLQCGIFIHAPYSLITTAVAADLGTHESVGSNDAIATVVGIIDGAGATGALIGPLLIKQLVDATQDSYTTVFISVVVINVLSMFCLTRPVIKAFNFY